MAHVQPAERDSAEELELREFARTRIRNLDGPGQDPDVARVFWQELSDWPEWGEWAPSPATHPAELERRDLA